MSTFACVVTKGVHVTSEVGCPASGRATDELVPFDKVAWFITRPLLDENCWRVKAIQFF